MNKRGGERFLCKTSNPKCFKAINFERFRDQGQGVSRRNVFQIQITLQTIFAISCKMFVCLKTNQEKVLPLNLVCGEEN